MVSRDLDVWAVGILLVIGLGVVGITMGAAPDAPPGAPDEPSKREGPAQFIPFAGGLMQPPPDGRPRD